MKSTKEPSGGNNGGVPERCTRREVDLKVVKTGNFRTNREYYVGFPVKEDLRYSTTRVNGRICDISK